MEIERIARACHEANAAYCLAIGETTGVYPKWDDAPKDQRESCMHGVAFVINNPDKTPEQLHTEWFNHKVSDGWVYGEVKDPASKTHPCLVEYNKLPVEQRVKDFIFRSIVDAMK